MNPLAKSKFRSSVLETYLVYLLITWTIIIIGLLLLGVFQIRNVQHELVKKEAQANFNKDQSLRFWSTTHGGVYVPATEATPPNPFLNHVKERDIKTSNGKVLTLMNPAYMLRQTMAEYETLYGVRGHITSLKYFRPETAPDEWEKLALQEFERGTKEIFEYTKIDGKPYYRYMSPMSTKRGCLKCHGHQGYKVGDVRGGVSVSVPMTSYLINQQRETVTLTASMALLWLLGFIGLTVANRGLKNRSRERDKAEANLQKAYDTLEQQVKKRTAELVLANEQLQNGIIRRKFAEEKIARFGRIFEDSLNEIFLFESDTLKFVQVNPAALHNLGYTMEELEKLTPIEITTEMSVESFAKIAAPLIKEEMKIIVFETVHKRRNESLYNVEVHLQILKHEHKTLFTAIIVDITDRKRDQEEKAKLGLRLQQSQKMESIGTLAGGIAHDFNNILFPIIGHTQMLLEDVPEESPYKKGLNQIYTGAIRASELVKQILTFSRQESGELKLMKMQPIIKEALKLIRSTIPTTIEIKQDISPACDVIKADPTQIHQIVMNLATNAYHAMAETGGGLKVGLKQMELGTHDLFNPDMIPGQYACLTVVDTGTGMDKGLTQKIFDPFFTTKAVGKGTGMGLSVVHGIVEGMGGTVRVYSEPGKGTQFYIYFPIEKGSFVKQSVQTHETIQGGIERILLVDDEDAIITMEKLMLERLGYKVTSRTSSIEALEAFRDSPDKFSLVITDMAMPNMPGDKLSAELNKIRPDIPILLCSGFSETMSEGKAASLGINGFLLKPIVMKDLAQKIREVLDSNKTENTN